MCRGKTNGSIITVKCCWQGLALRAPTAPHDMRRYIGIVFQKCVQHLGVSGGLKILYSRWRHIGPWFQSPQCILQDRIS